MDVGSLTGQVLAVPYATYDPVQFLAAIPRCYDYRHPEMLTQRFEDRLTEVLQVLCHHAVVRLGEVEAVVNAISDSCSRTGEFVQCKVLGQLVGFHSAVGSYVLRSPPTYNISVFLRFSHFDPTFFPKSAIFNLC